jgi:HK97 family phage prohead protease
MKLDLTSAITVEAAAGDDAPKRRILGLAVPWNKPANASTGPVKFLEGSLPIDGPAPKLIRDHDLSQPIGIVDERVSTAEGMLFSARISETAAGNEALVLAADGVLDSVSVGVEVDKFTYEGDTLVVEAGRWRELSLVPFGAFSEARVLEVAASEPDEASEAEPENPEEEPKPESEEDEEMNNETPVSATVATAPIFVSASPRKVTAAEYISAIASGNISPAVRATLEELGTSDTPGILPETLVGDVYSNLNDRRPFIAAIGTLAMPRGGETFYRRKISQHVEVDVQSAQFDELASQKLTIDKVQVDKATYGGALLISEQEIDWTDPAAVNLVLTDMGRVYAKRTETVACAALVAGVSQDDEITDWTDGDEILDALFDASATINAGIDELPTHVFLSPDRWADLGKAKTASGDRIFPSVGPMNAAGTMNPSTFTVAGLGLNFVVSGKFASGTFIIGNPAGTFELYEQNKGAIRIEKPSTLAVELAYRGYFAAAMIEADAFVKFVDPA